MIEAKGIPDSHPGMLQIRVFVARHDNQHRGAVRTLANIPCTYGEAADVFNAWKGANSALAGEGYNSPVHAQFNLGYIEVR